ncbi:hypothetical protein LWI29_004452 [Acer saccharum]|uniref:Partial AB-hydrolase lipase domain-containing protein n=1 Tax=Acer saccharum TaxID=4024 RepID=A0AA39SD31_ACESA|nr:hypothetical protein LWI29_004452 [Acer saccharum]
MAITLTISTFLVILISGSVVALLDDGICFTLVKTQGYACEEHTVTTQDGYILSLQRIPMGRSGGVSGKKPPVLLQHGLLLDAASWLLLPPDQALAFVLADNGFDVWLANTRGTKYSRGHAYLSGNDLGYWGWSWDELVTYELPAMFRYVYNETGQKLHYVGHSQGTLLALAALSKDKVLLNMWRSASLLAPFAYLGTITSHLTRAVCENIVANVSHMILHPDEIIISTKPWKISSFRLLISEILLAGRDCCLNTVSLAALLLHGEPSSTMNLIHLSQMVTKGTFAMYDYNDENENRKFYGQPTPPAYKLENIQNEFPLYLFHGGADALSDVEDVQLLLDGLKHHNPDKLSVKFIEKYAHFDFVIGYNSKQLVTTKDGYILSIQRMPKARSGKPADKPPVLLQHGLMMDAITWLLNAPDQSLAFILADNGYDVWISNTRGTKYSRGHTSLTPNDQGTLIAFAAFSQDKLMDMIRSAALLSPIAHLGQMSSPLGKAAADAFLAEDLYWLGLHELAPRGEAVAKLLEDICQDPGNNCSNLMNSFTGQNCCLNSSRTNVFLEHEPQSTATTNMIHVAQMIRKGTIAKYDYGNEDANMNHYGQPTPPVYDMTGIPNDFPLLLSYGGKDYLSDVDDVQILLENLEDHLSDKLVVQYREDYAHADFVFGVNANKGTLIALASFSEDQLMNYLRSAALLSPIAYVGQVTSPLARNAAENFLAEGLYWLGLDEFDPKGKAVIKLLKAICAKPGVDCTNLLTSFTVIRTGTITMYDYDDEGRTCMKHYGQANPPAYNMTSIPNDFPLFLGYGGADALSDVNDVKLLLDSLKDHDGDKVVTLYRDDYAHADYVMAENAKQVVYDPLMAFFKLQ